jgi:hypothetical protein
MLLKRVVFLLMSEYYLTNQAVRSFNTEKVPVIRIRYGWFPAQKQI